MPEVSGRLLLAQDLRNRFETQEGTLGWDTFKLEVSADGVGIVAGGGTEGLDYGYDLRTLVNTKQRDLTGATGRVVAECVKDDRVDAAQCKAAWEGEDGIRVNITVDDGDGPFEFTLLVSSLTVELVSEGL